ncbi:putative E3 ubiquitin ligase, partial [Pseudoloma neurophilia]
NGVTQNNGSFLAKDDFFSTIVDNEVDIRKFSYVIKDQDRILPLYELSFKFDIELELKSRKGNICERCEKNDATMFCVAERAAFCEECDQKIHFDSFTKRHIRHYYSNLGKQQKFFHCLDHQNIIVDYFCEQCQIPLCTECRLRGSHFNHKLITYFEADKSANLLKNKDYSNLLTKNEKCIESIRLEVSKFRNNMIEVQNDLEKQYFAIKKELDLFIKKKYQIFNARYLEFWNENCSINFTSDFVNNLDNSEIIKNYATILNQQNLRMREEFKAKYKNIFLHGTLSIKKLQEEKFRKNRSLQVEKTKEFYAESTENRKDRI